MLDQQIPPVTLDDLLEFQAKHFLTDESYAYSVAANVEDEDDVDELGYYEDGVKRTLTDEQIKIFRHSEIHALFRERQRLREQSDEESPTPADLPTTHGHGNSSEGYGEPLGENFDSEKQASELGSSLGSRKRTISEQDAPESETFAVKKTRFTNIESADIDAGRADVVYDENEDKEPTGPQKKLPVEQSSIFRQRVISYADD